MYFTSISIITKNLMIRLLWKSITEKISYTSSKKYINEYNVARDLQPIRSSYPPLFKFLLMMFLPSIMILLTMSPWPSRISKHSRTRLHELKSPKSVSEIPSKKIIKASILLEKCSKYLLCRTFTILLPIMLVMLFRFLCAILIICSSLLCIW